MSRRLILFLTVLLGSAWLGVTSPEAVEEEARRFLEGVEGHDAIEINRQVLAQWVYATNITEHNLKLQLAASSEYAKFQKDVWSRLVKFPWREFSDPQLRRRFQMSSVLGAAALPAEKFDQYEATVSGMTTAWNKARVCSFHEPTKCDLALRPEITALFESSRDEAELRHVWLQFRTATGNTTRPLFQQYVQLSNEVARANNFTDQAALWLRNYESADFRAQLDELWRQLKPLYLQLHAYVRRHLRLRYGESVVSARGPIPSHLLGHIHAQTWGPIADFMLPFPTRRSPDITPVLVSKGFTPLKMFHVADEFFTSLNLTAMPDEFWERSALEKPTDGREFECQASAWDFYNGKDFRIKQCTRVTQDHLETVHHEMGHVQYFLQYRHQPIVFREGANPGFHEAVGDAISLSVLTPKHLRAIGLLEETPPKERSAEEHRETTINRLFQKALDKLAFLPSAIMMDEWRWDVFQDRVSSDGYNCHWWKLREKYQGVEPAAHRTEEDFDPGSKYHIVASVPYIRYFVSYIIQFQFHRALCDKAGQLQNGAPLHECDIYKSTAAGNLLGSMLQLGSSRPWPEAMELLTGQPRMDATPLREYFAPLETWLTEENRRTGEFLGWDASSKVCVQTREELARITAKKHTT